MKRILTILFVLCVHLSFSQSYFYLEDIKLKKKIDFTDNENNVVKAIDYLLSTPIDEKNYDRKACDRFIIRYAEKCSTVKITIGPPLTKMYGTNTELLVFYMGLWMKSTFNNKNFTTEQHEKYIFTEIYKYSKAGNNIEINEAIKALIKSGDENTIDNWISEYKEK